MTNPVILLGTQSNGETLPVQVDATGRLVAEGLPGEPGAPGEQGPEGPPGPQGEAGEGVPLNGSEGDVLTWVGGTPTWVSQPNGEIVWPDQLTADGGWLPGSGSEKAFDGTSSEASTVDVGGTVNFVMPVAMQLLSFGIKTNNGDNSAPYSYQSGSTTGQVSDSGVGGGWMYFTRLAGLQFEAGDSFQFQRVSNAMRTNIKTIELNGEQLFYDVALRKIIRREVVKALIEVRKES